MLRTITCVTALALVAVLSPLLVSASAGPTQSSNGVGSFVPSGAVGIRIADHGAELWTGGEAQAHHVADMFNRLKEPPDGPISCPADRGGELRVSFRYPGSETFVLRQETDGCLMTRVGGDVKRWAESRVGHRLLRVLKHG